MCAAVADRYGPYEIVRPLSAGGMGEVYLARDVRLERDVAPARTFCFLRDIQRMKAAGLARPTPAALALIRPALHAFTGR